MTLQVNPEELRDGAGAYASVSEGLQSRVETPTDTSDTAFGHVEFADWVTAVIGQLDTGKAAIIQDTERLAERVVAHARHIDETDDNTKMVFDAYGLHPKWEMQQ